MGRWCVEVVVEAQPHAAFGGGDGGGVDGRRVRLFVVGKVAAVEEVVDAEGHGEAVAGLQAAVEVDGGIARRRVVDAETGRLVAVAAAVFVRV